ncbi:MAG: hypothetical protein A4E20_13005 [Nitrospira sp. SG-bin2]|nr:MAG: hypothetical protein A4E20_13005 [Nitrospira sp. SG-bin2]
MSPNPFFILEKHVRELWATIDFLSALIRPTKCHQIRHAINNIKQDRFIMPFALPPNRFPSIWMLKLEPIPVGPLATKVRHSRQTEKRISKMKFGRPILLSLHLNKPSVMKRYIFAPFVGP